MQARPLARMARDEVQHLEGGDVGGVEIVEHDHDRSLLGDPANELGDRIEEPEARLRGIAMCRTAHLVEQDRELGRLGTGRVEERAKRPPQSTQGLEPGVVGGCAFAFAGSTPRHDEPASLCSTRQLLDEARLSDAGLAGNEGHIALPGHRRVEERVERAKLVVPADEDTHLGRWYPTLRSAQPARF